MSIDRNLGEVLQTIEVAAPVRVSASANRTGVDIRDYVGDIVVTLSSSAGGGITPTLDVKLQESDDNSTFTDITGAAFAQVTDAADSTESIVIDADATKRYIRAVDTVAGTSPTFDRAIVAHGVKQVR